MKLNWRCITHGGIAAIAIGMAMYFNDWPSRIVCGIVLLVNSYMIIRGD